MINKDDVGTLFKDENGEIWEMISYTDLPTYTIENVKNGTREHLVVGSLLSNKLKHFREVTE